MKIAAYLTIYFLLLFALTSCRTSSYYVSPMYGSSNSYRTLPFMSDSVKSSLYANGAFTLGGTNQNLHDEVYTLQGNIYNAHQFGRWKAWYGTGLSSGIYHVRAFPLGEVINPNFDTGYINAHAGSYFFGSYNLNAGILYCLPLENGSEWRILHFSPSFQKEFGRYKNFRQALHKDSVSITGLATSTSLVTLSLGSELSIKSRKHEWFNVGLTYSWIGGNEYKNAELTYWTREAPHRYNYFTLSGAYTYKQHTPFIQFSFGHRLTNLQVGYNYCITSQKRRHDQL
jgi:hypothetical protein